MRSPTNVYLLSSFAFGTCTQIVFVVSMLYQVETVGLNALQLVLVGTVLELSAFVFEIPTGVVADLYSRKLSVVLGFLLTGLGFAAGGLAPTFEALLLWSFLWGLGWTFMSGAKEAWLADEIGAENAAPVYLRAARLGGYGSFLGIILGAGIGLLGLHLNFLVGGLALAGVGVLLWFLMEEHGFTPTPAEERETFAEAKAVFLSGASQVRASKGLLMLMFAAIVFGAFSEGYDRLSSALLIRDLNFGPFLGLPVVVWWALLAAASSLTTIAIVSYAERRLDTTSRVTLSRALTLTVLAIGAAAATFAVIGHLWIALALFVILPALRGIVGPLETAWINQLIDSRSRATIISMHGQADALGQSGAGPTVGWGALTFGLGPAIATAALMLVPVAWLYRKAAAGKNKGD